MLPVISGRKRGRVHLIRTITHSSLTLLPVALLTANPSAAETAQPTESTELPRVVVTAPPPSGRSGGARPKRAPVTRPLPAAPAAPPSTERTPLNSDAVADSASLLGLPARQVPATVEVIVHENTAANMQEMRASTQTAPSGQPPNIFKANNGRGMPKKTFKDRMTIGTGADRIDLYYFGRGHTNGDAWVVFPALRAMHAGDIFSGKNIPGLDAVNGGSGLAIADSLTKAADTVKNIDTIITGHSRTMTVADLREYAQFNRDFANDVRTAKAAGKSADEVAKAWKIPAKYAGYATPTPVRLLQNVQVVFDELK